MEEKNNQIMLKTSEGGETRSMLLSVTKIPETDTIFPVEDLQKPQIENKLEKSDGKQEGNMPKETGTDADINVNGLGKKLSLDKNVDPENRIVKKQKLFSKFCSVMRKNHISEKLIFLVCVACLVFLGYSILCVQWILPYFYTITTPLLLLYRLVTYCQSKWQLFMCDFCYFGNVLCFIYIWAVPSQTEVFTIFYAFCTGPIAWATLLYRNSLVFHSVDKITSVYIHILPVSLAFCIRWYSGPMSSYWYTDFVDTYNEEVGYMFIWLIGLPYAIFLLHVFLYTFCVYVIWKPADDYLDSIRYLSLSSNGCTGKVLGCMGPTHKTLVYNAMCVLYGFLSIFALPLLYKYFVLHCILVAIVMLLTIWNGACYYIDYFGPRAVKL